jgi:CheY-like chemotaxis protein
VARVLILDDDVAALAVAKRAVRAGGHDAFAVTSVADALAALDAPSPPDVLLASPAADAGEALVLAERTRSDPSRARVAVLLVGDAGQSGIPAIPVPLDGPSLGARIAAALASRAPPALAPPSHAEKPQLARPARRPVMQAAEASLRALFRRHPSVRDAAPPTPPPSSPPPSPAAAALSGSSPPTPTGASIPPMRSTLPPAEPASDHIRERLRGGPPTAPPVPRRDVAELVSLARTADYFSLLGVQRSASTSEVREAAARLLAEVDAQLLTPARELSSADLQDARQVLLDARDVLADDGLRAAYLNGIEDVADSTAP